MNECAVAGPPLSLTDIDNPTPVLYSNNCQFKIAMVYTRNNNNATNNTDINLLSSVERRKNNHSLLYNLDILMFLIYHLSCDKTVTWNEYHPIIFWLAIHGFLFGFLKRRHTVVPFILPLIWRWRECVNTPIKRTLIIFIRELGAFFHVMTMHGLEGL